MSRSGYSDDLDDSTLWLWRGTVKRATEGKRGQRLLRAMRDALDAMPEKRLITAELVCPDGVCALGAVAVAKGIDVSDIDPGDRDEVARTFDIAGALAAEIAYANDEGTWRIETPEERWTRMRAWVESQIKEPADVGGSVSPKSQTLSNRRKEPKLGTS